MNKNIFIIVVIMSIWIIFTNIPSQSYGSSEVTNQNDTTPAFLKADGDCFAWKFYLLTTIYDMVYRSVSQKAYVKAKKYSTPYTNDLSKMSMYNTLPPQTARDIINTIIEKEGGHCSKEVLYEIPLCTYDLNTKVHPKVRRDSDFKKDNLYHVQIRDVMDFDYFAKAMEFPINKKLVSQYEYFLRAHIIEEKYDELHETRRNHYHIYLSCEEGCSENNDFYFSHYNGFGTCMIAKNYKHLRDHDIFDFKDYLYGTSSNPFATLNRINLENFIKESNTIAKRYSVQ